LKVVLDPLEAKMKQKDEKLLENVFQRLKTRGLYVDKKVVEKGLLHPPNIAKKHIETTRSDLEADGFIKTGEPGIISRRKKKESKMRSESTHVREFQKLVML
jgi:hypothetical protein